MKKLGAELKIARLKIFIFLLALALVPGIPTTAQAGVHIGGPSSTSGSVLKLTRDLYQPGSASTTNTTNTTNITNTAATAATAAKAPPVVNRSVTPVQPAASTTNSVHPAASSATTTNPVQPAASSATTKNSAPANSVYVGSSSRSGSVLSLKSLTQPTPSATTQPLTDNKQAVNTSVNTSYPVETELLTGDEQAMVDLINQERLNAGVNPVTVDYRLVRVARIKANDMKENNYFGHISPTYGSPFAMMQNQGLAVNWGSENIDANSSVSGAMSAFMFSPAHRANILDPKVTHVGIGIAYHSSFGTLYVQEFLQE